MTNMSEALGLDITLLKCPRCGDTLNKWFQVYGGGKCRQCGAYLQVERLDTGWRIKVKQ